ncbi:diaminopimelate epimerase [Salidesulfovibrio brasiliensis]|uniref:diaminopimelate epimerase n=1 Tax=Salidesulfovibrio brasiliensis TaxID=221711 RepID=UPI0006D1D7F6|nr:diaminopimelate epimerase [Salidesulfovibrio brasiliensis]
MSDFFGQSVPFFKMQGCGNDFVVIDNRELNVPEADMAEWAEKVCARAFGVCADGLFFIDNAPEGSGLDYRWHFYNNDGSRAEMCGNASRCMGRLAFELGIAPREHTFGTDAGPIKAEVITEGPQAGEVKVQLTPPQGTSLNTALDLNGETITVHFADTGVPHAVVFLDDVSAVDIKKLGAAIRYHEHFAPAGTNANFAQVIDENTMLLRTYERGVEDETYACGTGAAATQLVAHELGLTAPTAALTTSGKEVLTISLENDNVFLQGAATLVFKGELYPAAMGLKLP